MKILKFYADWCNPCKLLTKNIEEFSKLYPEIEISSINVEDNEEFVNKYNIRNIPVLIKLNSNDEEIGRNAGLLTLDGLKKFILE